MNIIISDFDFTDEDDEAEDVRAREGSQRQKRNGVVIEEPVPDAVNPQQAQNVQPDDSTAKDGANPQPKESKKKSEKKAAAPPPHLKKRKLKRRPKIVTDSWSIRYLSQYFHMSEEEAAKELGISKMTLKHALHWLGMARWPFRKVRAVDDRMKAASEAVEKARQVNDAVGIARGLEELAMLTERRRELYEELCRPAQPASSSSSSPSEDDDNENLADDHPPQQQAANPRGRGRGRPRGSAGRGGEAIVRVRVSENDGENRAEQQQQPARRGRGRPRGSTKKRAEPTALVRGQSEDDKNRTDHHHPPAQPEDDDDGDDQAPDPANHRGRGRGRPCGSTKRRAEPTVILRGQSQDDENHTDHHPPAQPEDDDENPADQPANHRRRGRRRGGEAEDDDHPPHGRGGGGGLHGLQRRGEVIVRGETEDDEIPPQRGHGRGRGHPRGSKRTWRLARVVKVHYPYRKTRNFL